MPEKLHSINLNAAAIKKLEYTNIIEHYIRSITGPKNMKKYALLNLEKVSLFPNIKSDFDSPNCANLPLPTLYDILKYEAKFPLGGWCNKFISFYNIFDHTEFEGINRLLHEMRILEEIQRKSKYLLDSNHQQIVLPPSIDWFYTD